MCLAPPYFVSFTLAGLLTLLTLFAQNYEFLLYAVTVMILVVIIYKTDPYFGFARRGRMPALPSSAW